MAKSVLLVGASGLTGSRVLKRLINDDRCTSITILVRSKIEISSTKLIQQVVDFDLLDKVQLANPIDTVFLCLGTTIAKAKSKENFEKIDRGYNIAAAKLGIRMGAKNCALISAVGADSTSSIFYNKVKGLIEVDLGEMGFDTLNIFRPGLLIGERKEQRLLEKISQAIFGLWTQKIGIFGKYASISVDQLAEAMIESTLSKTHTGIVVFHIDDMKKYFH